MLAWCCSIKSSVKQWLGPGCRLENGQWWAGKPSWANWKPSGSFDCPARSTPCRPQCIPVSNIRNQGFFGTTGFSRTGTTGTKTATSSELDALGPSRVGVCQGRSDQRIQGVRRGLVGRDYTALTGSHGPSLPTQE